MALDPVRLGFAPTLHFHETGAVTYLSAGETGWDDDAGVILTVAA